MHDEGAGARRGDAVDETIEAFLRVLVVDADAAFHGDGERGRLAHRLHALGHKVGLGHQAGAEPPRLHPVRRTADIEIDLVIAVVGADLRRLAELCGVAAAKLKPNRMLLRREAEHAGAVAVEHGLRRHHFGIEERPPRNQP